MTDYEMICRESKNLSTEEQARVSQYIQSIQNEKGGGKRKSRCSVTTWVSAAVSFPRRTSGSGTAKSGNISSRFPTKPRSISPPCTLCRTERRVTVS